MSETKNIVIKVKYGSTGSGAGSESSAPKMITEWNVKRIIGAVGIVGSLLALSLYLFGGPIKNPLVKPANDSKTQGMTAPSPSAVETTPTREPAEESLIPPVTENLLQSKGSEPVPSRQAAVVPGPPIKSVKNNKRNIRIGRVRRAVLSYEIVKKEPVKPVGSTLFINKQEDPVTIHYFTEIRNNIRQPLFHEWLKDGILIYRHELNIASKRWRTSSQREFKTSDTGHWLAQTVDESGNILNQINFEVSEK